MTGVTSALRAASMRIALEPRMLFDGAAAATADAAPVEAKAGPGFDQPEISAASSATVRESGTLWFDGLMGPGHAAPVQVSDPNDGPGDLYQVKLWVSSGGATIADVPGADIRYNGQDWVELTGSLEQVNQALAGLRIDAADDSSGDARLGIQVNDPDGYCVERWITICVVDGNDPPVAGDDSREFSLGTVSISGNVITGGNEGETADYDPDGDSLSVIGVAVGDVGTVSPGRIGEPLAGQWGELGIDCDGNYVYRPGAQLADLAPGEVRTDVFTYLIEDPEGATDTATLSFVVRGVDACPEPDSPPFAVDDFRSVVEGSVLADGDAVRGNDLGDGADSDPDGDALTVVGVTAGSDGSVPLGGVGAQVAGQYGILTIDADGAYRYDATTEAARALREGEQAVDRFTYSIADPDGNLDTATITIQVIGINLPPQANPDAVSLDADHADPLQGNVISGGAPGDNADADPDPGDALGLADTPVAAVIAGTVAIPADGSPVAGAHGTLVVAPDGGYSYTIDPTDPVLVALGPGATVQDRFTYTVRDQDGATSTTTLVVTIIGVNEAPTAPTVSVVVPGDASFGDDSARITDVPPPTDADQPSQDLTVIVTGVPDPANGQFVRGDGTPVVVGDVLPAAGLRDLSFVPRPSPLAPVGADGNIPAGTMDFIVDDNAGGRTPGGITVAIVPAPAGPGGPDQPGSPGGPGPAGPGTNPDAGPGTGTGAVPGAGPGAGPGSGIGPGPDRSGAGPALPGLLPPMIVDPLEKGPSFGGGGWLPEDPVSPFGPRHVLGMVEEAAGLAEERERTDRLAKEAIAAGDDCVPLDPVKPVAKPKPKAVPRSAMTELARPKVRSFSEQVDTEKKRFKPPAKIKVRAVAGRQC